MITISLTFHVLEITFFSDCLTGDVSGSVMLTQHKKLWIRVMTEIWLITLLLLQRRISFIEHLFMFEDYKILFLALIVFAFRSF